jgi:hypothetical protein
MTALRNIFWHLGETAAEFAFETLLGWGLCVNCPSAEKVGGTKSKKWRGQASRLFLSQV